MDADAARNPRGALRPPGCQGPPLKAGHRQEGSPGEEDVGMMIMMMYKGNYMKKQKEGIWIKTHASCLWAKAQ